MLGPGLGLLELGLELGVPRARVRFRGCGTSSCMRVIAARNSLRVISPSPSSSHSRKRSIILPAFRTSACLSCSPMGTPESSSRSMSPSSEFFRRSFRAFFSASVSAEEAFAASARSAAASSFSLSCLPWFSFLRSFATS